MMIKQKIINGFEILDALIVDSFAVGDEDRTEDVEGVVIDVVTVTVFVTTYTNENEPKLLLAI